MNEEIESRFVSSFIRKEKQERMREFLPSIKRRGKILSTLNHFGDLDKRYAHAIPPSDQSVDKICKMLEKMGAPKECHLISSRSGLDGRSMPLQKALGSIVGMGDGTLVICIPEKLGYYEGESINDRWLLSK